MILVDFFGFHVFSHIKFLNFFFFSSGWKTAKVFFHEKFDISNRISLAKYDWLQSLNHRDHFGSMKASMLIGSFWQIRKRHLQKYLNLFKNFKNLRPPNNWIYFFQIFRNALIPKDLLLMKQTSDIVIFFEIYLNVFFPS